MSKPFFTAVLALSLVARPPQDDQPRRRSRSRSTRRTTRAYYHSFKGDPEIGDEFFTA